MTQNEAHIIFDMDSTLLSIECLDAVIHTALSAQLEPEAITEAMEAVDAEMVKGMEGGALLEETIPARIHIAKHLGAPVRPEHFAIVAAQVQNTLTTTIVDALVAECSADGVGPVTISVVSGGPQQCVDAAVLQLSTRLSEVPGSSHIQGIGNEIHVTEDGSFDTKQSHIRNSKVETIRELTSDATRTIMVGDGSTDYEVYAVGAARYFIGVGFWVARPYIFDRTGDSPFFKKVRTHEEFAPALHTALYAAQN